MYNAIDFHCLPVIYVVCSGNLSWQSGLLASLATKSKRETGVPQVNNYNPNIDDFLRFYSQSERSTGGTRGYHFSTGDAPVLRL
jgi:hypothetical protein